MIIETVLCHTTVLGFKPWLHSWSLRGVRWWLPRSLHTLGWCGKAWSEFLLLAWPIPALGWEIHNCVSLSVSSFKVNRKKSPQTEPWNSYICWVFVFEKKSWLCFHFFFFSKILINSGLTGGHWQAGGYLRVLLTGRRGFNKYGSVWVCGLMIRSLVLILDFGKWKKQFLLGSF